MRTVNEINNDIKSVNIEIENMEELIADKKKEIASFDKSEHLTEEKYDEMLDDCYGEVTIAGMTFATSTALYKMDEIAYRCGMNDYADSMDYSEFPEYVELEEELEDLENTIADLEEELEELEDELEELEDEEI